MKAKILFLFLSAQILAQAPYPKNYFRSPMDIPIQLAGNFGELRSNHFHAGFDIRTQQREGLNIYAVGDGHVSRIKISAYGYGKAIYIDHPNGFTTVYGHLKEGSERLEAYIRAKQYELKSFEIDVFPRADELPVIKGDMIAYSGNTGGSEGPHLHFEFRDTKSEKIINPMHFGFDNIVLDNKRPVVTAMYAYPVSIDASVNAGIKPVLLHLNKTEEGIYTSDAISASGNIGFGINGYDSQDYGSGKNGIYKVSAFDNGNPTYSYQFDSFAFDQTRFINALIDYPTYKQNGIRIQKTFLKSPLDFDLFKSDEHLGQITVAPNTSHLYRLDITDFHGNLLQINVPVNYEVPPTATASTPKGYLVSARKDSALEKGKASVFVPANTFYEDAYFDFDFDGREVVFGDENKPAHSSFTVSITDDSYPENLRDKVFIASNNGRLGYNNTKRKNNVYTCYSRQPGKFRLAIDTIAPKVGLPKNIEGKWISKDKSIAVTISDNLSGIKSYSGYLNGNWVLFEFDYKTKRLTHYFSWDDFLLEGRNELKIELEDSVGNSTIFETHFFRSKTP